MHGKGSEKGEAIEEEVWVGLTKKTTTNTIRFKQTNKHMLDKREIEVLVPFVLFERAKHAGSYNDL